MASLKEQLETLANNYTACDVSLILLYKDWSEYFLCDMRPRLLVFPQL